MDTTQVVGFAGSHYRSQCLACGVPQGVLGPLLVDLYSATEVINIAVRRGVRIHAYDDDLFRLTTAVVP